MLLLGVVATLGLMTMSAAAQQPPVSTDEVGFMGANPSGKLGRDGKPLISRPVGKAPQTFAATQAAPAFQAECPPTVHCVVIPAAYSPNNSNVEDYGNYDLANRPNDMAINTVVIHDTEGDLQSVIDAFQNPTFYASTHYVIDTDGTIYQMVQNKNMAWHAGNWSVNMHSIGIEHVGHAALGGTEYTPAMYQASSQLVKYLTDRYHIPKDRARIIGHENVPGTSGASIPGMHVDPGPFWNWQNYMAMMGAPVVPSGGDSSKLVTVAPVWPLNKPRVTGCSGGTDNGCVPDGLQPANFVYLRTEPRSDAPFFTDTVLGQGSTEISNNAARLFHGQTFAVADRHMDRGGIWYQVWANGQKGWFYSPWNAPTAMPASGKYVTPKASLASVPTYGRAIPERSEYPADLLAVPPASWYVPAPTALPYAMTAGQRYKVIGEVPTDHFYAWASDSSFPYDHTVFKGSTKYLMIQLGNRLGFVKASNVDIK
jgi:hypothetical protein